MNLNDKTYKMMMTKKQFWQSASNWGMVCGVGLFVISLMSWALKFTTGGFNWPELLRFGLIFGLILYTGRRNAAVAGAEGYSYGRAVGFVFAMMMFAGIVAGVGEFLMSNFIARDYYDGINAAQIETALRVYQGTPMESRIASMSGQMARMLSNPFVLIFSAIINCVIKGGFLGLILGAFVKRNPHVFAADNE